MFEYIHSLNPSWKIDKPNEFKEQTQQVIHRFLFSHIPTKHKSISPKDIDDALRQERQEFTSSLIKDRVQNNQLPFLMEKIINRDHHFIISKGGRPRSTNTISYNDPYKNPFISYFCYYGIDSHPTGNKLFDDIYRNITELLKDKLQNDQDINLDFLNTLIPVIERHYENFPHTENGNKILELAEKTRRNILYL
ncbi:MAG TPA: hypothetical protein VG895_03360 [Patescibacteria group bacterium]|nr:hypothetical protein [Patescibacteria group bacterium]